jgi:chromate transporter
MTHQGRDGDSYPSLKQIVWTFASYANFTLGGGSATTAVMHQEMVERRHWLTDERFALCYALGRLTPGTNLLAVCTGIGWALQRAGGALAALLAASIPCTLMVVVLTALFSHWQDSRIAQTAIHGAIAAAVAITVKTCWTITKPLFKGRGRIRVVIVGAAAFLLYGWAGLPPIEVLLLAAVVGLLFPVEARA